jgi:hypothetical protein
MTSQSMRFTRRHILALSLLVLASSSLFAQRTWIPREHHAWGRFNEGSWIQVRKITEEFDERGNVKGVSTTETKTTLTRATNTGCTLRLEVTVEVAGKRIAAQPRDVSVGYLGQANGETAVIKLVRTEDLDVGGKSVSCDVFEVTINGADENTVSTIYHSDSLPPFVLKRVTTSTAADGKNPRHQTLVDAVGVEMPYRVLAEIKTAAYIRTVKKHANGSTFTLEVFCADVPGGVVAHTSKDLDEAGRLIRRSTLELLDYGVADRRRLFGRLFRHHAERASVRVTP